MNWWQRFRRSSAHTQANIVCTFVIMLATVAYALIAKWQLGAMKGQLGQMQGASSQTDHLLGLYQEQLSQLTKQASDTHRLAENARDQADRTKEIAETSRDALIEVQRAVMSADDLVFSKVIKDNTLIEFQASTRWKNSGATSTKNLRVHYNWKFGPQPFPGNFDFNDLGNNRQLDVPSFASPQKVVETTPLSIPTFVVRGVIDGQFYLVFWGSARYRDVFRNTMPHVSEFCAKIVRFTGIPLDAQSTFGITTENCTTHNCHDEECSDYKKITKGM